MENHAPHTHIFSSTLRQSSSSSTLFEPVDDQTFEKRRGEKAPLFPANHHKYGSQTFLSAHKTTLRLMRDEVYQAAREYHSADETFDVEAKFAEARTIYHRSMRAIHDQGSECREGLEQERAVERICGQKKSGQKTLEKVKHRFRTLRLKSKVDHDEQKITQIWEEIVHARMLYGQAAHGGYVF